MAAVREPRAAGRGTADAGRASVLCGVHRSPGAVLAAGGGHVAQHAAGLHSGALRGNRRAQRFPFHGAEVGRHSPPKASDILGGMLRYLAILLPVACAFAATPEYSGELI